jgi:hypothetical protein
MTRREVSKIETLIPIGYARALGQKQAYELALSRKKKRKTSSGSELVCYFSCNAAAGVLKAIQEQLCFCR